MLLDRDSTVTFARIRLTGDTLYGWPFMERRAPGDSVAVALRRVIAIEQDRVNVPQTLGAVLAGVMLVVTAGFVALLRSSYGHMTAVIRAAPSATRLLANGSAPRWFRPHCATAVIAIEQNRLSVLQTIGGVMGGVMMMVTAAYLALFIALQGS